MKSWHIKVCYFLDFGTLCVTSVLTIISSKCKNDKLNLSRLNSSFSKLSYQKGRVNIQTQIGFVIMVGKERRWLQGVKSLRDFS